MAEARLGRAWGGVKGRCWNSSQAVTKWCFVRPDRNTSPPHSEPALAGVGHPPIQGEACGLRSAHPLVTVVLVTCESTSLRVPAQVGLLHGEGLVCG